MDRQDIFLLDGKSYHVNVMSLKRKFAVTDTEEAGRVMSYDMYRDIIGTFYSYTMEVRPYADDVEEYNSFYDALTDPYAESHTMTFPYGSETLTFQAYVSQGEDELQIRNGTNYWGRGGLSLEFVAIAPQRRR